MCSVCYIKSLEISPKKKKSHWNAFSYGSWTWKTIFFCRICLEAYSRIFFSQLIVASILNFFLFFTKMTSLDALSVSLFSWVFLHWYHAEGNVRSLMWWSYFQMYDDHAICKTRNLHANQPIIVKFGIINSTFERSLVTKSFLIWPSIQFNYPFILFSVSCSKDGTFIILCVKNLSICFLYGGLANYWAERNLNQCRHICQRIYHAWLQFFIILIS